MEKSRILKSKILESLNPRPPDPLIPHLLDFMCEK